MLKGRSHPCSEQRWLAEPLAAGRMVCAHTVRAVPAAGFTQRLPSCGVPKQEKPAAVVFVPQSQHSWPEQLSKPSPWRAVPRQPWSHRAGRADPGRAVPAMRPLPVWESGSHARPRLLLSALVVAALLLLAPVYPPAWHRSAGSAGKGPASQRSQPGTTWSKAGI